MDKGRISALQNGGERDTTVVAVLRAPTVCASAVALSPKFDISLKRDRRFESISLQRRVRCEPVSRGNSPSYVEKPRFSAGVRAGASGAVGRDAQDAATSGPRAVISLSGHIPVPHRR